MALSTVKSVPWGIEWGALWTFARVKYPSTRMEDLVVSGNKLTPVRRDTIHRSISDSLLAFEPAFENVRGRLFPIVGMNGSGTRVRINLKDQLKDMSRRLSMTSEGGSSGTQSISQR